ncbi:integral membrane protein GPR137-like [Scyliorhinus canicula]|uniref:integral membrane protein GPR137-like n=1 Tax=Scyliorhinus canicula TaxID=7830 RepID=UPI0018F2931B|nr:integral membrane protein GPR137-like [Scyliorhinus canicula]
MPNPVLADTNQCWTLSRSKLEYCEQILPPYLKKAIRALEEVPRTRGKGVSSLLASPTKFFFKTPTFVTCRLPVRLVFLAVSLLFLTVNLTCALLVKIQHAETKNVVLVRVIINDSLFVVCAITLAACLYVIAKTSPSTSIYLESKGTSVYQTTAVGALVILLYASRACYNLVAVMRFPDSHDSFDYGWYNVSDQADLMSNLGDKGYLVFGFILFFWELLPTTLLVLFFRVRRPAQDLAGTAIINGQSFASRSYFFDNPRQFEGDDSAWAVGSQSEHGSLSGSLQRNGWYGTERSNAEPTWYEGVSQAATAPLLFARDHVQGTNYYHTFYSTPQT